MNNSISSETHAKMVEVLAPVPEVKSDTPQFSLDSIEKYLELYWIHFDPLYPIFHNPTFVSNNVEAPLLIAIVTIGMAYSNDPKACSLAIAIHRKFRNIVFLMIGDQPQVPLWVHQTLLLTNYFDKMLGSSVQYDMSQFFHGTNIAMMHFSGYLKGTQEPDIREVTDQELADKQWHEWIIFETTKRTAFFAFVCDTQHATLFRHSPILSAFEVRLELPSTDACWAAPNGLEFIKKYKEQREAAKISNLSRENITRSRLLDTKDSMIPPQAQEQAKLQNAQGSSSTTNQEVTWPFFLHSLKHLIRLSTDDQMQFHLATFSPFSCFILLHGLLSICWDMQWRGLLDMGIVSKRRMGEFKTRLEASFKNWKDYFDYQLSKSNMPPINSTVVRAVGLPNVMMIPEMNNYASNSPMICSNWAMFQLGLLALHVDTMSLRINAGSPNVLGRKIREIDRENSSKAVRQWANSDDGGLATWYSLQFMRAVTENEAILDQAVHIPWGVYLASLTIWSYECYNDG
ncbi:fungal-specific transcription factor domain-containing protein, partial [Lipomyces oligophaga]|uniref:fungal-specific transcription factor domain-containing protein n=1 Tax=Lipomyces oligophaga TaxID=45792 RepID=UPI0034CF6931